MRYLPLIVWLGLEKDESYEAIVTIEEFAEACVKGGFEQWRERFESKPEQLRR